MAKEFKDLQFVGKKLSGLTTKYISVSFDADSDIVLGLEREMQTGESNRYRTEPNYFYDTWSDGLSLELNIVKDPCAYPTQKEMEITSDEIREITRWLTSSHFPDWLKFENETVRYKGWFNNIETFVVGHTVYGLKLYFKCTTPFAYTDELVDETTVSNHSTINVINDSDELNSYNYPTIELYPNETGQIYLCNLSDCKTYETGTLTLTGSSYFDSLLDVIDNYAKVYGYTVEYSSSSENDFNIVPICNSTAVQFYLVDHYSNRTKCTAFYMEDTKLYRIIEGGFIYMTVYKDLKVFMDCQNLTINDDIGRMVTYDKLGISDVDQMYWLRLLNGTNTLLLYGKCKFTIKHIESRKVGE